MYFGTRAQAVTDRDGDPLASYLVLAPSPGHDGILRARDVPALGLAADLVILAGVRDRRGRGDRRRHHRARRAFLTSGPTGLITTLYRVGERAGLDLMIGFHEAWLLDGLEPVERAPPGAGPSRVRAAGPPPRNRICGQHSQLLGLGSHTRALPRSEPETWKATPV